MTKKIRPILSQNAYQPGAPDGASKTDLLQRREQVQGAATMLFFEQPLHIVRGEGCYLFDDSGRRYLDFYNNVPLLGHSHPALTEALARQFTTLNTNSRYLHEGLIDYSEQLLATFEPAINRLLMTCTGSESNDLAMRLATRATGRRGFIVSEAAYHGNTTAVTDISPSAFKHGSPPPHVQCFSLQGMPKTAEDAGPWLLAQVQAAWQKLADAGYGCAALIADSIFSSDGVFVDPPGFLKPAVDYIQKMGALFIADEVQPGFGRSGNNFWGYQCHAVTPDVVTMGKPMGNGYPVAAVACRADLLELFCEDVGYFNTFGGSTAAVCAAQTVLDTLTEQQLQANAHQQGQLLAQHFSGLMQKHRCLAGFRGTGLYWALDVRSDENTPLADAALTSALINTLRDKGVLTGATGVHGTALKLRPPMILQEPERLQFIHTLDQVLSEAPL